jgi:2-polyprenyl-6-hydroxyphenyl methylase/3-demethylubiquinone-9 3-methyltransferase
MPAENLCAVESHFKFGDNWASFASGIDEEAIAEAERGLLRLIPRDALAGRTFLDIGCGSGIHALAALRLGAVRVLAVDIDARSVETTRELLTALAPPGRWSAEVVSVFDLRPEQFGTFDVVYSWGVLHHTGDLDSAMRRAGGLVAPGGLFAFALYRATRLDRFWIAEKRWYKSATPGAQRSAQRVYAGLFKLALAATGRSFTAYQAKKKTERGMDFDHDVRDWLGGYPYEAIAPAAVASLMQELGFSEVQRFARARRELGLFGSGCDEYVYRKG